MNAGNNLSITSGRDATLHGAQVSGEKVVMDVGRDLTLSSQQDEDYYDSKQQSVSAGGSISFSGGSGSVNASRDKMHSSWQSVQEQTGVFAGSGGYDITVGKHTRLDGAVIGSTATSDKNRLDTGTLGFSNIENRAEYQVEHQSVGISSGGSVAGQFVGNMANGLLAGMNGSGSDSSTTKAAVSEGTIIIRDAATQQQDVEGLSRDVEHANQTLSPIFDKEKEQRRLKEAQLIGEIGSQAADIARTQGQIEATRAANDKMKSVTPEQLQAARKAWSKANPGKEPTDKQINEQAYQTFYDKAFAASDFGTGSKVQRAIQAATAAVQGLAGGDLAKAVAGGSAPYIANIIGNSGLDSAGKVLAHAAVNAALAAAQGNSALVGATGAATAELAGIVAVNAYGKPVSELSETEKQTVSALATLAAGLAGGLAGDGTADAVAGAQAGKTTVENNYLSSKQIDAWSAEMKTCQAGGGDCGGIIKKYEELSTAQQKQLISDCASSPTTCQQKYGDVLADSVAVKQAIDRALGEDIPIKMVYDLTATFAHQMQAEGVVATNKVSEALQKEYGLDEVQAGIVASAAASAFGGISKAGKPNYTLNKDGAMLGINGPTVPSKTLWMGKGKERIDVENPAPGKRAGQIHYQDNSNKKYYYDPVTQTFPEAPKNVNDKLKDPAFKSALDKGMTKYLGEK
ncbi:hypothetical protein ERHA53_42670 [Erwinia rhapontici]|uniref:VENN motif-containing domain-containing protein n=1 Tax=Erwinia rhapontici TaxID=55212 RepID=A0ABN6DQ92_ERWRD|nr:hypothetical protein ERHA53_42670 [Erwinia rhapontici]